MQGYLQSPRLAAYNKSGEPFTSPWLEGGKTTLVDKENTKNRVKAHIAEDNYILAVQYKYTNCLEVVTSNRRDMAGWPETYTNLTNREDWLECRLHVSSIELTESEEEKVAAKATR